MKIFSDMDSIFDGRTALTACAKLQYTGMGDANRETPNPCHLKYCELDALTMEMVG